MPSNPITELPGSGKPAVASDPADDQGEIVAVEGDAAAGEDSIKTDDGGEIVKIDDGKGEAQVENNLAFYDNLLGTEVLTFLEANPITTELVELIDNDKKSREDYDKTYAEGIARTGLGNDAPGGATFQGASKAVHPMLSKAAIDYASRAMGELFPGGGQVVRDEVLGQSDDFNTKKERDAYAKRCDKAKRISALMNWQLVHDVPEFRNEMDKLLTQTPLAGSQFLFWAWNEKRNRPTCRYWPTDMVWFDYGASSAATAERLTLVEEITEIEFRRRVKSGEYVLEGEQKDLPASSWTEQNSKAQDATDKAQGVQRSYNARVGYHLISRTFMYLDIEDEEAPYTVVTDLTNDKMLSCVRNWEEIDKTKEPLTWAQEIPFLPWRGALSLGTVQFIGSLAGAATGSLRALLDSAHLNNFPAGMKLKGANFAGQSDMVEATGLLEVEGGIAGDNDIRKLFMPMPYNPPSPVLLQLLGIVSEAGEGFVQTALKNLAEGRNDMPVGTTLALIEQGLKTLSGIHSRLHAAMTGILRIVYRLNRLYITDEEIHNSAGVLLAKREDFQGPMDVVPVSDPEVFSDAQRFAQLQLVAARAQAVPGLYNLRRVEEMILGRTKIPNALALLNPEEVPEEANAVTENVKMAMGKATIALPHQDHLAHLQVLLDFLRNPMLGMNPLIAPRYLPLALHHIADHVVLWYATQFEKVLGEDVLRDEHGDIDLTEVWEEKDPASRKELDKLFATASPKVADAAPEVFGKLPPIIQAAQQMMQQFAPQMQQDPTIQAATIRAQADAQKTDKVLAAKAQESQQKAQGQQQEAALDAQTEQQRQQSETQRVVMREQGGMQRTQAETASHEKIADQREQTRLVIANAEAVLTREHEENAMEQHEADLAHQSDQQAQSREHETAMSNGNLLGDKE